MEILNAESAMQGEEKPTLGVLALQGSFAEHIACLRSFGREVVEVRTVPELERCAGLVIPGGESTVMAKLAKIGGLMTALQRFAQEGKPIYGTCAGLIFLAKDAVGVKQGGQDLLGNLDVTVARNFFGSQV